MTCAASPSDEPCFVYLLVLVAVAGKDHRHDSRVWVLCQEGEQREDCYLKSFVPYVGHSLRLALETDHRWQGKHGRLLGQRQLRQRTSAQTGRILAFLRLPYLVPCLLT